ncbi:Set Domain-Containing Protein 9 [Manis pentadactyla]|nr:Set Domain-Containing Protein 9 [Manis pentadactyla]
MILGATGSERRPGAQVLLSTGLQPRWERWVPIILGNVQRCCDGVVLGGNTEWKMGLSASCCGLYKRMPIIIVFSSPSMKNQPSQ